jgi:hypothetical protein
LRSLFSRPLLPDTFPQPNSKNEYPYHPQKKKERHDYRENMANPLAWRFRSAEVKHATIVALQKTGLEPLTHCSKWGWRQVESIGVLDNSQDLAKGLISKQKFPQ